MARRAGGAAALALALAVVVSSCGASGHPGAVTLGEGNASGATPTAASHAATPKSADATLTPADVPGFVSSPQDDQADEDNDLGLEAPECEAMRAALDKLPDAADETTVSFTGKASANRVEEDVVVADRAQSRALVAPFLAGDFGACLQAGFSDQSTQDDSGVVLDHIAVDHAPVTVGDEGIDYQIHMTVHSPSTGRAVDMVAHMGIVRLGPAAAMLITVDANGSLVSGDVMAAAVHRMQVAGVTGDRG